MFFSFPFISFMTFVHQFSIQAKNIPWKSILTSLPVWALLLANVTRSWVFATMVMEIPQYFADVFGLNVATVWFFLFAGNFCITFGGFCIKYILVSVGKIISSAILDRILDIFPTSFDGCVYYIWRGPYGWTDKKGENIHHCWSETLHLHW